LKHQFFAGGTALLLASCASAQTMQQVTVTASKTIEREQSTTTSIVIGREEILRQGDSTLADVLKRQPGITIDGTPGRPAAIRMRGLGNGYASILLDGLPAPAGFALESISPDLIERIEIMRAATAEFSNQAIAGAINVVLRKSIAKTQTELKAGTSLIDGHVAPTLVAQRSGRSGALAYTVAATVKRTDNQLASTAVEEGIAPELLRYSDLNDRQIEDSIELAPRLSWQPDERETLVSQTFLRWRRINNRKLEHETTVRGDSTGFPNGLHRYRTAPLNLYSDLSWTRKLAAGAQLTTKLAGSHTTRDADFVFLGSNAAYEPTGVHQVASGPTESDVTLNGSYRRPLGAAHALAFGWEAGRKKRSEYRREQQFDGAGKSTMLPTDEHYDAQVQRTALFVQDEWEIGPRASLYLGLRREDLHTTGAGNAHVPVDVNSGVWSPIVQALFKRAATQAGGPRDQFRLALTRTYKAPAIALLMPRRYTVDNNNSATNPDQQGNPNLRPELAFGMDVAWERYFGKDNLVSVGTYIKRIGDVTVDRIYRQGGVWIITPDNNGDATVRGIELETKLNWPGIGVRANITRNWSRVDNVPRPDNRLDGQVPLSANLGLDYKPVATALSAGGTFSYRSGGPARESSTLSSYSSARRELDLYAAWQPSARARVRVSASNIGHPGYVEQSGFADERQFLSRTSSSRTFTAWRLVWEQTL
jgi:outer membrane receptor protein involved in Fe transport